MPVQTDAIAVLMTYNGNLKISTRYDSDEAFRQACIDCLPDGRFEYPDWCERTVSKLIWHAQSMIFTAALFAETQRLETNLGGA